MTEREAVGREIDRLTLGAGAEQKAVERGGRRFQNILVAVDGTPGSAHAVAWAAWIGSVDSAKVHFVTVIGPLPYTFDSGEAPPIHGGVASWHQLMEDERRQATETLDSARVTVAAKGLDATTETGIGSPASVVSAMAEQRGADLVICGSNAGGALERVVLGSVADGIKNNAPCAVLIAKQPPVQKRVLLPTDGSELSRIAAITGARLAAALDVDARLLHVVPGSRIDLSRRGYEEVLRAAKEAGAVREAAGGLPDHITSEVAFGRPHEVIEAQADRMDAGLVVMGSRGFGQLRGRLLGSVSNPVSHRVKSSLLFIKPTD